MAAKAAGKTKKAENPLRFPALIKLFFSNSSQRTRQQVRQEQRLQQALVLELELEEQPLG